VIDSTDKNDISVLVVKAYKLSSSSKRKTQMPATARAGLSLLIVGAIFVGVGSYTHRGGFSLYGLPMVMVGFALYLISSITMARRKKQTTK
jgi:membrane-bound ClpP family serine protease